MAGGDRDPGRKEKAFYLVPTKALFSCSMNKGPCIFILHRAPQIMCPSLPIGHLVKMPSLCLSLALPLNPESRVLPN